jgi:hypothetical protein
MLQGDLFKRLSLEKSFRRMFDVYVSGFYPFTKIAAVLVGVKTILQAAIVKYQRSHISDLTSGDSTFDQILMILMEFVLDMVLTLLFSPIAEGSMTKVVADIYTGREPDCAACLKLGVRKALPLLMTSLLVTGAVLSGILLPGLLFIYPAIIHGHVDLLDFLVFIPACGIYISVVWFVVGPAIILENFGITGSLKRSYNLVSGNRWYVFLSSFCVSWCIRFALFSITGPFFTLFFVPLPAIINTVTYFNLRVEKEGLNANDLLRGMEERAERLSDHHVPLMDDERHRAWVRERRILKLSLGNAS